MTSVYSRLDQLGLYLRFGSEPIVSFSPQTWGGVYFGAASVHPVDHTTVGKHAVAFDIRADTAIPWSSLSNIAHIPENDLRGMFGPELARLGMAP